MFLVLLLVFIFKVSESSSVVFSRIVQVFSQRFSGGCLFFLGLVIVFSRIFLEVL